MSLPFLEAMLPSMASAAVVTPRLVAVFGGVPTSFGKVIVPTGALNSTNLLAPVNALASVSKHVSMILNTSLPVYAKGTTAPPGGCVLQQHGCAPAPLLAGVTSYDGKGMLYNAHTVDQVFADAYGQTKFKSIQARVQAVGYGYGLNKGTISSRFENGVTNYLAPMESPLQLYTKLFSGFSGSTTQPPVVSSQILNRRSVLDLVLGDATRLMNNLSGQDKIRLDQHFTEIRELEKRLALTATPVVVVGSCSAPSSPGADPIVNDVLGGWGSETQRGDLQADIIALALACDLTRAVSWQLTFDQCGLTSQYMSGVIKDLHQISHDVNNDTTGLLQAAMGTHLNWHCARFAKLVAKLASLPEGSGTVLDNTFLAMGFGEGVNAHNRNNMHMFIAGCGSRIKLGQCIDAGLEHPAKLWIAGLNALGHNTTKLGEISGVMQSILL